MATGITKRSEGAELTRPYGEQNGLIVQHKHNTGEVLALEFGSVSVAWQPVKDKRESA